MAKALSLILVHATLAQSAEQTLRKRQVKGSSPLGGLADVYRPQLEAVGAFVVCVNLPRPLVQVVNVRLQVAPHPEPCSILCLWSRRQAD